MIHIHRKYHPDFKNIFSKVIYISILNQDLFSIMLTNVPLAKASHMTKPLAQGEQSTREVTTDNHLYSHLPYVFII